jgi:hypothetical protein
MSWVGRDRGEGCMETEKRGGGEEHRQIGRAISQREVKRKQVEGILQREGGGGSWQSPG